MSFTHTPPVSSCCAISNPLSLSRVQTLHGLFHGLQIGQSQFGIDDLDIVQGIDLTGHVNDVTVFKTTYDVRDGIGLANIGEKFVAQALTLGGTCDQAGDIDKLHGCRYNSLRFNDFGQIVLTWIRNRHHPNIGLDGAEGIVRRFDAGLGQGIKEGRLTNVRQADDSTFDSHIRSPFTYPYEGCSWLFAAHPSPLLARPTGPCPEIRQSHADHPRWRDSAQNCSPAWRDRDDRSPPADA